MEFKLKTPYIELYKLLKLTGLCESGGQAKTVIDEGLVRVNGEVEKRRGNKIRAGQTIQYQSEEIKVL